jgi:3-dehydroquinate synthase
MTQDKKMKDGALTFVLARGIGKAVLTNTVPPAELEAALAAALIA